MKHSIILIVGDAAPQYAELSNREISELWSDVQSRCLPKVLLGWFDERNKFCQMSRRAYSPHDPLWNVTAYNLES
jgi:hypothetical protein